jgi:hypothetical protein
MLSVLAENMPTVSAVGLSFSKQVENHIGAIKFFICHYNLEKAAALPV